MLIRAGLETPRPMAAFGVKRTESKRKMPLNRSPKISGYFRTYVLILSLNFIDLKPWGSSWANYVPPTGVGDGDCRALAWRKKRASQWRDHTFSVHHDRLQWVSVDARNVECQCFYLVSSLPLNMVARSGPSSVRLALMRKPRRCSSAKRAFMTANDPKRTCLHRVSADQSSVIASDGVITIAGSTCGKNHVSSRNFFPHDRNGTGLTCQRDIRRSSQLPSPPDSVGSV
jgi:hypothetical protein